MALNDVGPDQLVERDREIACDGPGFLISWSGVTSQRIESCGKGVEHLVVTSRPHKKKDAFSSKTDLSSGIARRAPNF
jgi:hypothetical protein